VKIGQILPTVVLHDLESILNLHNNLVLVERSTTTSDFNQRRLIAADLIASGDLELWYELFAQKTEIASDKVMLTLTWVSDQLLPKGLQFILKFGNDEHPHHILHTNSASWELPVKILIDPRSGRLRAPLVLIMLLY